MNNTVLLDPSPRLASDIFTPALLAELQGQFQVIERGNRNPAEFYREHLPAARFVIGQPALDTAAIESAKQLRAIFNVEGNFLQNMDYDACFRNRIHVLTISPVFAQPVAELALGLTLALARDIPDAHQAFSEARERYGLAGNADTRQLQGCELGFIGFGDLGRAILRLFTGFRCRVRVYDPWLSPAALRRDGLEPAPLDEVLANSDVVQVVASVTPDSRQLLGPEQFRQLRQGSLFLLLSRADIVDFDALMEACTRGQIRAATDVFPVEPLPGDHPLRTTPNLLLSAHRAGALQSALYDIGERVLADLQLMQANLPPQNCKRAEHELVTRLESRPVSHS